jgi:hypothetical protein
MRRLFLALLFPSLLLAQASPLSLHAAENQYLEDWDSRGGNESVPVPQVDNVDMPVLKWLVESATRELPANPFVKGKTPWREAEAIRHFVQSKSGRWSEDLKALPLTLSGSYVALWRWGKPKVRSGRLDKALRLQWEDRLLVDGAPDVVRDMALRHALCFALAENDGDRLGWLKDRLEGLYPDIFLKFQSAFSLIGVPPPVVHLWTLPQMQSVDLPLNQLGGSHVRIEADPGQGLPQLPADTAWVVPTLEGSQPEASVVLEGSSLAEARPLIPRLEAAKRTAYLAPVRKSLETYALMYFPIQIELGSDGTIMSICMGDAELARAVGGFSIPAR